MLSGLDYALVTLYLLTVLGIGLRASSKNASLKEYFLAGRQIGVWLAAISLIATETSAATVVGGPDTAYRGDLTYLQTTIGAVISRVVLSVFVVEVYYRNDVTTVYEFLSRRFGRTVQSATAALFCFGRLLASGARLYIAGLAVALVSGMSLEISIVVIGVVAILYGATGGLRAVVWTDALQGVLFLAIGVYSLYLITKSIEPIDTAWMELQAANKLRVFDFDFAIFFF